MHRLLFLGLIALFIATPTYAQTPNIESAFREYGMVGPINVIVPTVIELPIYESVAQSGEYMVIEEKTGMPQPSFLRQTFIQNPELVDVRVYGQSEPQLTDGNRYSGRRFEITSTVDGRVSIELISRVPVTSSHIDFAFGQNVAYPTRIQVIAYGDSGNENIVYRESAFYGTALAFIPTTARHWRVDLVYAQPLQINEIVLSQDSVEQSVSRGLRFLGQPNSSYRIFQDPDRYVSVPYGVSGILWKMKI
jgi:hypothetical protein